MSEEEIQYQEQEQQQEQLEEQEEEYNIEEYYQKKEEEQEIVNGDKIITKKFLKNLINGDLRQYYGLPELNSVLYLHFKGFNKITNLEPFTGLNCLYLEGNAISNIEGLDFCQNLKQLCLHQNCISKITNLSKLKNLVILNLQENFIQTIEGLEENSSLETLQIGMNKIGVNGMSDLKGLLQVPSLKVLDIKQNCIKDSEFIDEILVKMPNLQVLYQHQNEFVKGIKQYRKNMIHKLVNLRFLDETPIKEEDRKFADAYFEGGLEKERQVRKQHEQEAHQKSIAHLDQYRPHLDRLHKRYEKLRQENRLKQNQGVNPPNTLQFNNNTSNNNNTVPDLEQGDNNNSSRVFSESNTSSNMEDLSIYNSTQQSQLIQEQSQQQSIMEDTNELEELD